MNEMSEVNQFAFEQAIDLVKQLITLSTGILGLFTTFFTNLTNGTLSKTSRIYIFSSLGFNLLSILFGLLAIMAGIGNIKIPLPSVYDSNVAHYAAVQIILFLSGGIAILLYAINRIIHTKKSH